jgi:HD-like signal output (HDOD) protein
MGALPVRDEAMRRALEARLESGEIDLPLLPASVATVLDLCYSPDSSASSLSKAIHRDQGLAGHLLRVANSPAYFADGRIVSLQQAISRLGQRTIGEIAVAISVRGAVFQSSRFQTEVRALWGHAAAAGAFAREIARALRKSVDTSLLCGLLQDVGKPVVIHWIEELETEQGTAVPKQLALDLAEEFHTAVGACMVERWSMPPAVIGATRFHHRYSEAPAFQDEARIAHLSDRLAQHLLAPETYDAQMLHGELAFAELNLYPDDVDAIVAKGDEVRKFAEAIA